MTTENQDRLKCQLKQISYGYIYTYDFSKQKHILSKEEWEALTDLRKDDSIIITKPNKGNGVVIVNKLDYLNKMKLLVSDETKFKKLTQNPTKSREDSLISYLRKLKKDKIVNDATFHKILPCGSTPGVLCDLPKVHKPGCPFRPIVFCKFYNYNLASYLYTYFSSSPRINSRSRTLLVLWTGPRRITITMKSCARLTLVHCLQSFR